MPKDKKPIDTRPILISVRPSKRGYIVEAAGSNDPYPCKDADDIGEAVLDILNDPDTPRMEDGPTHAPRSASPRDAAEEDDDEDEWEDDYDPPPSRGGGNTADDIIAGALSMLLEKGRKISHRGPK
jgi:hypothetical protein